MLEDWMRSYQPEELFDENGTLLPELAELAPKGERRMGANPHANGGLLLQRSAHAGFPRLRRRRAEARRRRTAEATRVLGDFLRDVMKLQSATSNFRVFGPDETASNRLDAVFEVTDRVFDGGDPADRRSRRRRTAA